MTSLLDLHKQYIQMPMAFAAAARFLNIDLPPVQSGKNALRRWLAVAIMHPILQDMAVGLIAADAFALFDSAFVHMHVGGCNAA